MSIGRNERIVRNTGLLYIRLLLTMAVSLYTSRVVLDTLGVADFGIYHVVGGFVVLLGFLQGAMASATQRFLSFELGRNDHAQLKNVFSMSVTIHVLIAVLILLIAETVGIWFLTTRLTIPAERIGAAQWVFHFSLLAFLVAVISVPYNAAIIAHERMQVFAWASLLDAGLKLLVVFVLQGFGFDKLKLFALLMFCAALLVPLIYTLYCTARFPETRFAPYWNHRLFRTMLGYAGWNLWGNAALVLADQGVNILLNLFFGPTVNAGRAIAFQVGNALHGFSHNLQTAMNPQVVKSFAANDLNYLHQLVYQGAKYNFFLLFFLALPLLAETETLLGIWLKSVPEYAVVFTRLLVVNIVLNSLSGSLAMAALATGKIRLYHAWVSGILLLTLPLSYVLLRQGFAPQATLYASIGVSVVAFIARLKIVGALVQLSVRDYLVQVLMRVLAVVLLALPGPLLVLSVMEQSVVRFVVLGFVSVASVGLSVYLAGLGAGERAYCRNKLGNLLARAGG